VDVTPARLSNFYLGGHGIGPVHSASGVLRHIYFRVIAMRGANGVQVVIGALDSQGYSVAYQQGPHGFRDVENDIHAKLGIPPSHIVLQATHSHTGPTGSACGAACRTPIFSPWHRRRGSDVVRLQRANARAMGFPVSGSGFTPYGPGAVPPSTNCMQQQIGAPGLPVG
jgi:hypothetical protein